MLTIMGCRHRRTRACASARVVRRRCFEPIVVACNYNHHHDGGCAHVSECGGDLEPLLTAISSLQPVVGRHILWVLQWRGAGAADVCKLLVANCSANLEARSDNGGTPLHYAAFNDKAGAVRCLVELGAQIEVRAPACPRRPSSCSAASTRPPRRAASRAPMTIGTRLSDTGF